MTQLDSSDPLAKAIYASSCFDVICFVGKTAYRLQGWTLADGTFTTKWMSEAELIKMSTYPWQYRLKWRVRNLIRRII